MVSPGGWYLTTFWTGTWHRSFKNRPVPYTNFLKIYTRLYTNFPKIPISKIAKIDTVPYAKIVKIDGQVHNAELAEIAETAEQCSSARLSSALFTGVLGKSP